MNVLFISLIALLINLFLGSHRVHTEKFGWKWWVLIHASIPVLIPLRMWLGTPTAYIPLFVTMAVLGQYLGTRFPARKKR